MSENEDMAWHMANFIKTLKDKAINSLEDKEKVFFVPIYPSNPLDSAKIRTVQSVIEEFKIDKISVPNPLFWETYQSKTISAMF